METAIAENRVFRYTIMMRSLLSAIVAAVCLLGMTPVYAQYVSPEDMLYQQGYASPEDVFGNNDAAFLVPSGKRGAQWTADVQAEQSYQRHPSILNEPWDPQQDNGVPAPQYPPVVYQPPVQQPTTPTSPYSTLDPITARLLERLARDNVVNTTVGYMPSTAYGTGLPLAHTGPEAVLIVLAMVGAVGWTLRRARVLERFVRS
jgi:hypothetical protein